MCQRFELLGLIQLLSSMPPSRLSLSIFQPSPPSIHFYSIYSYDLFIIHLIFLSLLWYWYCFFIQSFTNCFNLKPLVLKHLKYYHFTCFFLRRSFNLKSLHYIKKFLPIKFQNNIDTKKFNALSKPFNQTNRSLNAPKI